MSQLTIPHPIKSYACLCWPHSPLSLYSQGSQPREWCHHLGITFPSGLDWKTEAMHVGQEPCVSGGTQTWSLALGMLDLWNRGGIFQRKIKAKPICFYTTGRDFRKQREIGESNQNQIKSLVKTKKNGAYCHSLLV